MLALFPPDIAWAHAAARQNNRTMKAPADVSHHNGSSRFALVSTRSILRSIHGCELERDCEQRCENREISREVRREAPVLAGVTKAAAGDIESAKFGRDRGKREDQDQSNQNRQRAAIENSENKPEAAENFQPGKIKRERHAD